MMKRRLRSMEDLEMTGATYVMLVLTLMFYWGGFIVLAVKAARADAKRERLRKRGE
jgi:hypothetical protein